MPNTPRFLDEDGLRGLIPAAAPRIVGAIELRVEEAARMATASA